MAVGPPVLDGLTSHSPRSQPDRTRREDRRLKFYELRDNLARAIPHAELVVIPGAGHMSNLERPDEFNTAVRGFCRRRP
jgi:pimeloyl-ACP methyl ester carboxylesterase